MVSFTWDNLQKQNKKSFMQIRMSCVWRKMFSSLRKDFVVRLHGVSHLVSQKNDSSNFLFQKITINYTWHRSLYKCTAECLYKRANFPCQSVESKHLIVQVCHVMSCIQLMRHKVLLCLAIVNWDSNEILSLALFPCLNNSGSFTTISALQEFESCLQVLLV